MPGILRYIIVIMDSIRYRLFDCTIRGGVDLGKLHGNAIGNSFTLYYIKYIFNIDEYRGSEPGEEGERVQTSLLNCIYLYIRIRSFYSI